MNTRRIIFSSLVTAVIGAGLGVVMASLAPTQYKGVIYQNLDRKYAVIGTVAGLMFGASQEAIRQMKQQRDREEAIADEGEQSQSIVLQLNPNQTNAIVHPEKNLL